MSRAPHVLVSGVVLGQPMGGVRRHNQELLPRLARALVERGGSLSILEGRTPLAIELPSVVRIVKSDVPAGPPLWRAWHESRTLASALASARERGRAFEVVHTGHLPVPSTPGVPLTWTIHDLRALDPSTSTALGRNLARRVIVRACQRAARVFTVSEHVRRALVDTCAADPRRIVVLGNGVDHLAPLPRVLEPGAPLMCVGHVERRKNLEIVLRALACDPTLPRLEIAGDSKAGERERLERLARELGIGSRVCFLGPFDDRDLAQIYARAACVVVPSHVEGFGLSALEAAFAAVPVCVADRGALPEIVPYAPRFDPGNAASCARAIQEACVVTTEVLGTQSRLAGSRTWESIARAWHIQCEAVTRTRGS